MNEKLGRMDIGVRIYKLIFNSIPIPAYIWKIENNEFILIACNKAAELITEANASNYIGSKLLDLFDKSTDIVTNMKKCFDQKLDFSKQMFYTYKSTGNEKTLNVSYKFLPPNFVIVYTEDITSQKLAQQKLKDSELQYRNTINSMGDAIHVIGENLKIILINPAITKWLEMIGIETKVLGKKINEAFPFLPRKILNEYKQVFKTGKTLITDEETLVKGKTYFTESRKIPIIIDGMVKQVITIVRDISERKISEQKFKKSEEKLKASQERYREAYNRSNFYKDIFAHDINNIFQNIQSSTELLSLILEELNNRKADNFIEIIKDQIIRGTNLISNIRKLSEIEEIESQLKRVEILEILYNAKDYVKKSFYTKKINIDIQSDYQKLYLNANELLVDIFENILINGIRYNNSSIIELTIIVTKEKSNGKNYVKMEFYDNGIGIPDEMKEKVFQRGYDQKGIIKGLGLGLTLVKKIIAVYGGQIWVEDKFKGEYSQGSKFVILLPEAE
ncbi:MAG: ATP-binding protein [Candidatus Heimdallarchaeota archaeon]